MIDPYELPGELPTPADDGACDHLAGLQLPDLVLGSTDGAGISLAGLPGRTVVYAYPRTGRPGEPSLVDDWDLIPGARGCTPETCGFRDHHADLALRLPTFEAAGQTLIKRLTLLIRAGSIERVWYPVFPPDRHAAGVLAWLTANPA